MNRSQSPILGFAGAALEAALNRALALDPDTAARLQELDGRSVELGWSSGDLALRLSVQKGELRVGPREDAAPDLGMVGSLRGWLGLAGLAAADRNARVEVTGDAQLARELEGVARRFAPDIEEALAQRLGNTWGPMLARALRGGWDWSRSSAASLREDVADFLVEERRDVIGEIELATFNREVDDLRDAVERLQARVVRTRQATRSVAASKPASKP